MERQLGFEDFKPIETIPENAPEYFRKAVADYNQAIGTDIGAVLEADRIARNAKLEAQKRRLADEQLALERAKREHETLDDEFAARRRAIADEKRLLLQRMAELEAEIVQITHI